MPLACLGGRVLEVNWLGGWFGLLVVNDFRRWGGGSRGLSRRSLSLDRLLVDQGKPHNPHPIVVVAHPTVMIMKSPPPQKKNTNQPSGAGHGQALSLRHVGHVALRRLHVQRLLRLRAHEVRHSRMSVCTCIAYIYTHNLSIHPPPFIQKQQHQPVPAPAPPNQPKPKPPDPNNRKTNQPTATRGHSW